MNKKLLFVITVLLLVIAVGLFLYTTENGVGLTNDSSAYIGGARSLLSGNGYSRFSGDRLPRPITQFPPLYSIFIAAVSKVSGIDALPAARWLNLACFIISLLLWIELLERVSGRILPIVIGGIAFLCCGPILKAFDYGLSEALYLPLFLGVLNLSYAALGLENGKQKGNRPHLWFPTGLVCGLLMLTRYAALAALGGLIVTAFCVLPKWKDRLRAVFSVGIGFAIPAVPWLLRNRNAAEGGAVNRAIAFHFPAADKLEEGIYTFAGFFFPEYGGIIEKHLKLWGIAIIGILVILFISVIILCLNGFFREKIRNRKLVLPLIQGSAYLVMLILDALFVDGSTVFDDRMLLPFFLLSMLFIFSVGAEWFSHDRKLLNVLSVCVMAGFALFLLEDETDLIQEYHKDGQGFAGSEWIESETRQAALNLGNERTFFSNRQTFLWLMNDQPSYILPPMFNAANFEDRENFEIERQWMQDEVLTKGAAVIVFNYQEMMENEEDRIWLETVLEGLPIFGEYADGAIFSL